MLLTTLAWRSLRSEIDVGRNASSRIQYKINNFTDMSEAVNFVIARCIE